MPLDASPARGVALQRILPDGQSFFGNVPRIRSCCTDAEQCQAGDLFVVVDEDRLVSQEEIETAIQRGAVALLSERPFPNSIPQFIVSDSRAALGTVCHALTSQPSQSLRTVGVAGTYGKSTTAHLFQGVMQAAGQASRFLDTRLLGDHGAMRLARWLADPNGAQTALLECGSESMARRQLDGTMLDAAAITNVRRGPIRWHGSLKHYQRATFSLLDHLKPSGFAVLNADDPACQQLLPSLNVPVLTIGIEQPAEVSATIIERNPGEQTFLLDAGNESIAVRTRMIGDGHIYNCLTTAALCLVLGIDPAHVVRGLESLEKLEGRLERIDCGQPFSIFIDSSHTPTAVDNALKTLRGVCTGDVRCLLGVDHRATSAERSRMGRAVEQLADQSVLTSTRLDRKMSLRNAHDILDGFDRPAQAHLMPDRAKAICWLLSQSQPGDIVLLAGGTESVGPNDVTLCDSDVAQYWLRHVRDPSECPWVPA